MDGAAGVDRVQTWGCEWDFSSGAQNQPMTGERKERTARPKPAPFESSEIEAPDSRHSRFSLKKHVKKNKTRSSMQKFQVPFQGGNSNSTTFTYRSSIAISISIPALSGATKEGDARPILVHHFP